MSDPFGDGRMSVTFKQDSRDGTWLVIHGTPTEVRAQIAEVFELSESDVSAPLFDLINQATDLYKATGAVSSSLGGRAIGKSNNATPQGSAWSRTQEQPSEAEEVDPEVVRLQGCIEAATSGDVLKELYARNKDAFDSNAELLEAWKNKGRSL